MRRMFWVILVPLTLAATSFSWRGDYDAARQEAVEAHKLLMVLVTTRGNAKTAEILSRVFTSRSCLDALSQKAVGVIVYRDGRHTYPIEMYYTTAFPTLFVVDPVREVFVVSPLYLDEITPETLEKISKTAIMEK